MENQNINNEDKNINFEELTCLCCDMKFKLKTDLKRHIKTNKHIKKSLGLNNCKCNYCEYTTNDKSNLKRHIKSNHPEAIKKVKDKIDNLNDDKIPKIIMKEYTLMKDGINLAYASATGAKHRIKQLRNRMYKDHEQEIIDAKKNFKEKAEYYNSCLKKIKDLEVKFPSIIEAYIPTLKPDNDEIEEDYDKAEILYKERKANLDKLEDIKDEIGLLYDMLKSQPSENIEQYKALIKDKELEYKALIKILYK